MTNTSDICGNCTMCCRVLGLRDTLQTGELLEKPAGVWCKHCAIGKGCKVYDDRPAMCVDFQCLYLQGVIRGEIIDPELRPDRCGVVINGTTDGHLAASCDPHKPDAWRRGAIYRLLVKAARGGIHVTISSGPTRKKKILMVEGSKRTGTPGVREGMVVVKEMEFTEPDEKGMQWSVPGSEKLVERLVDA